MISIPATYQSTFTVATLTVNSLFLLILLFSQTGFATEPLVNINSAAAEELAEKLSGIGPVKARAIVIHRELNGPFKSVDELIDVKGIGPSTLEKNRLRLVVYASNQLEQDNNAMAAQPSGTILSVISMEQQTRDAVQSVIDVARRDSAMPRH